MKNCISADKLTLYVDGLLEPQERNEVMQHLRDCRECCTLLEMFEQENKVLKETLSSPKLPSSFADGVLEQLEPIQSKRKAYWIRGLEVAAAAVLCVGLASAVSPGVNDYMSALFKNEADIDPTFTHAELQQFHQDFIYPVNYVVEGEKYKLVIEQLVVDLNRVGFTYKVLNQAGKVVEPSFNITNVKIKREDGTVVAINPSGLTAVSDNHGFYEANFIDVLFEDQLLLELEFSSIGQENGNWSVELPVDFKKVHERSEIMENVAEIDMFNEQKIHFEKILFTPSQTAITYRIDQNEDYAQAQNEQLEALQARYGYFHINDSMRLNFDILNEKDNELFNAEGSRQSHEGKKLNLLTAGVVQSITNEVTFPIINERPLFIRVNGIYKSNLEQKEISFDPAQVKTVKPQLVLSGGIYEIRNVNRQATELELNLTVQLDHSSFFVDHWILLDGQGTPYHSTGSTNNVDENGFGQMNITFEKPAASGAFTLVALTSTSYSELEQPVTFKIQ